MADRHVHALRDSVERLRSLAQEMTDDDLTRPAYPSEWSIADVLSHLGSGAVITRRRLDDALVGNDTPDDFAPGVWDEWNAKDPKAKRRDALAADAELMARLDALTDDERAGFASALGPMTMGFEQFVAMRLNEHTFHTWDIHVVDEPAATLPPEQTELVIDNLDLIARFTAKPTGDTATIEVTTTNPSRGFTLELTADAVTMTPTAPLSAPDLTLPAEAWARLVYGRLDPQHTPTGIHSPSLDALRRVFPGP